MAESEHQLLVNAWLERAAGRSTQNLIQTFDAAFSALWQRTHSTLGEVTLVAVVERVLHTAKERYPWLAPIETTTSGLRCKSLQTAALRRSEVAEAIGFVLTEFLTVLGKLTAEILTPALHAQMSKDPPLTVRPRTA